MTKERESLLRLVEQKSQVDETKVPQAFDLRPVYEEFAQTVKAEGILQARKWLTEILAKQLKALIQEQVTLPLSPEDEYEIVFDEYGKMIVSDPDYPQEPDIVKRAWLGLEYAESQGFYKEIVERYLLEAQQTALLVDTLAKDPILSLPIINKLAELKNQEFVSPWYTLVMPSSAVHQGNKSYFNVYRIVAKVEYGQWKFVVQTQGYYNSLSWNSSAKNLLNKDQDTDFSPQTEQEMMLHIGKLPEKYNHYESAELLTKLGVQAGEWTLPLRIATANRRFRKQQQDIQQAVETIIEVFELELKKPNSQEKWGRLKIFFEAIGNPLLLNKPVPKSAIIDSVKNGLMVHGNRDKYVTGLLGSIPSLANRVGGTFICGSLSAGGLTQHVSAANVNGFGGMNVMGKDNCMTCPSCHQISNTLGTCSICKFKKGMNPVAYAQEQLARSQALSAQPVKTTKSRSSFTIFDIFSPKETVSVSHLLEFGPKKSISVTEGLLLSAA